jgi:hypothetical protein
MFRSKQVLVVARVQGRKKVERPVKSGSICVESVSCRKQPEVYPHPDVYVLDIHTKKNDIPMRFQCIVKIYLLLRISLVAT